MSSSYKLLCLVSIAHKLGKNCKSYIVEFLFQQITYELPVGNQWCFDVQWCPRNPHCVSACSFDGRVAVYSIMGGEMMTQPLDTTSKVLRVPLSVYMFHTPIYSLNCCCC